MNTQNNILQIFTEPYTRQGQSRIGLRPKESTLHFAQLIKAVPTCQYDPVNKLWHIRLGRIEAQFAAVGKFYAALRQKFST